MLDWFIRGRSHGREIKSTGNNVMSIRPGGFASSLVIAAAITGTHSVQAGPRLGIDLEPLGSYREQTAVPGVCRRNVAEIAGYDPLTRRLFVTNYADNALDILDIRHLDSPVRKARIKLSELPGVEDPNLTPTSVAVRFPLVAVAAESIDPLTNPGKLLILGIDGRLLRSFDVGSGPDMVTFTPDGRHILVAVEGEPDKSPPGPTKIDPKGSVAILDLSHGLVEAKLRVADFAGFNARELVRNGVRIGADLTDTEPNPLKKRLNSAAKDLEPEFIAVSPDSRTAYATLQENNAIAVVDVDAARVTRIMPLGLKDHSRRRMGLDTSRRDGDPPPTYPSPDPSGINIRPRPVFGAYQPDGIAAFDDRDGAYLVTANEGDARNGDFDIAQLADLVAGKDSNGVQFTPIPLDPLAFPDAATLLDKAQMGELEISDLPQDLDPAHVGDGAAHQLVALGGRSFSIWDSQGHRLFDSGDWFERLTAHLTPTLFNTQDDDNQFDRRSPKRGPEPEGIAVGEAYGHTYAFVGLERHSGIMVYDVTDPRSARFDGYFNTRDFAEDPNEGPTGELNSDAINCAAGDLGPEGMLFISAWYSPNFKPLLIVNYETSGSTRIWEIKRRQP